MKRLILVRHGKSSWEENLPDVKRPLKERAYNDAQLIVKAFNLYTQEPIKAISSNAVRAKETAEIFKKELAISEENFEILSELYTFDSEMLIKIIRKQTDKDNTLMVFGHNPAMTETINLMGDQRLDNLPTTGLAIIDFEVESWSKINRGKTLVTLFPKTFR